MKESCPQCGHTFGWRGPDHQREPLKTGLRGRSRYFCPTCSVELIYRQPLAERYLRLVGNIGLALGSGLSLYKLITASAIPAPEIMGAVFVITIIGYAGAIYLFNCRRHYFSSIESSLMDTPISSE